MKPHKGKVYVSITGLKVKNIFKSFHFWRHAIPSKNQAERSEGLIFLDLKQTNDYHHTLSVWKNREAMVAYRDSKSHLGAMKVFRKIATGKVFSYDSDFIPTWEQALELWDKNGRDV